MEMEWQTLELIYLSNYYFEKLKNIKHTLTFKKAFYIIERDI